MKRHGCSGGTVRSMKVFSEIQKVNYENIVFLICNEFKINAKHHHIIYQFVSTTLVFIGQYTTMIKKLKALNDSYLD